MGFKISEETGKKIRTCDRCGCELTFKEIMTGTFEICVACERNRYDKQKETERRAK